MTQETKDELINEVSDYQYKQSGQVSTLCRYVIYGIVGTVWVLSYVNGNLEKPNILLLLSIIFSFIYLLLDVIHYYMDTFFYYRESHKLMNDCITEENHAKCMVETSKRSFVLLTHKFILTIIISLLFVGGMILKFI